MNIKIPVVVVFTFLFVPARAQSYIISSPSNQIKLEVRNGQALSYAVSMSDRTVLLPSPIGFEFRDEPPMYDFLPPEKYILESWSDGSDADTQPVSVVKERRMVGPSTTLTIKMAVGGGFAGRIKKITK